MGVARHAPWAYYGIMNSDANAMAVGFWLGITAPGALSASCATDAGFLDKASALVVEFTGE